MGFLSRLFGREKNIKATAHGTPQRGETRHVMHRPVDRTPTRRSSHVNDDEITTIGGLMGYGAASGDYNYDGVSDYAQSHGSDSDSSDSSSYDSGSSYSSGSDSSYSSGSDSSSYDSGSSGGFDSSSF